MFLAFLTGSHRYSPRFESLLYSLFAGVSGVLNQFSQIQPKVRISSLLFFFFGFSVVLNQFSQIQPKVRISSLLSFLTAFLASLISSHKYQVQLKVRDSHL